MAVPRVVYFNIPDNLDYEQTLLAEWGVSDAIELVEVKAPDNRPETFVEAARGADGVLVEYFEMTKDVFAQLPDLKIVSVQAIGTSNIDLAAASAHGVYVSNAPGFCVEDVALHTVGMIIDLVRNISLLDRSVRAGQWDPMAGPMPHRISGKTIGLAFFGGIPQAMTPILQALGLKVAAWAPTKSREFLAQFGVTKVDTFEELCATSDFVSMHTPLIPETRHLVDERTLALMKPSAYFINTARGGVVDEPALVAALEHGTIAGAAIDVIEDEDTETTDLRTLSNVVITPHGAFLSAESFLAAREMSLRCQVDTLVDGVPPRYLVNKDVHSSPVEV